MNGEQSPKNNVSLPLCQLVWSIGRGVPEKCQDNQAAAIKSHRSSFHHRITGCEIEKDNIKTQVDGIPSARGFLSLLQPTVDVGCMAAGR